MSDILQIMIRGYNILSNIIQVSLSAPQKFPYHAPVCLYSVVSSSELCSLEITCGPHTGCTGVQPPSVTLATICTSLRELRRVSVSGRACNRGRQRNVTDRTWEPGSELRARILKQDTLSGFGFWIHRIKNKLTCMMAILLSYTSIPSQHRPRQL